VFSFGGAVLRFDGWLPIEPADQRHGAHRQQRRLLPAAFDGGIWLRQRPSWDHGWPAFVQPVPGMERTKSETVLAVRQDGGISFGDAGFSGRSAARPSPPIARCSALRRATILMLGGDGKIYAFGDAEFRWHRGLPQLRLATRLLVTPWRATDRDRGRQRRRLRRRPPPRFRPAGGPTAPMPKLRPVQSARHNPRSCEPGRG
jgi:hypothetical protein